MLPSIGEVSSVQPNGDPPTVVTAGAAPGESGVFLVHLRFQGGARFRAELSQHLVSFVSAGPLSCTVGGKTKDHQAVDGGLAILPAGADTGAETDRDIHSLLIAIDPGRLALASADDRAPGAQLIDRLDGYDGILLRLGRRLAEECADGFPRGALYWNETADQLLAAVAASHTTAAEPAAGVLGDAVLGRIRDYLMAHLDEPIDVETLAGLSGRSQFHFSRIFRREVGVSPHRYVVHLRLRRAIDLVRDGKLPFAEIAAATGFADQSHLSRWVKRVHGGSLTQFSNRRPTPRSTNLQDPVSQRS